MQKNKGDGAMNPSVTSFDQLPITLKADQVAAVLGISRSNAYNLMRSEGFPTLHIGKRMLVPKDRLIRWIDANAQPEVRV